MGSFSKKWTWVRRDRQKKIAGEVFEEERCIDLTRFSGTAVDTVESTTAVSNRKAVIESFLLSDKSDG